ncbi:putative C-S lyase [Aquibacillus halophilus]|uniref:cysteine-S-conjugate beta-lyase n=1 Tax=Aquibacillus halophilus TaxID=930132 RepID=A0A6A8DNY4_9BACI|nr:PatB family C-S lyase [Aquibacillus halophilus]MRH44767.1 putative C-S lyase [Aquibacillus halophilus]
MSFDYVHERKGTRSVKWDLIKAIYGSDEVLPLWVADMDFQTPQPVIDSLVDRSKHGIFGYTITDTTINNTIIDWLYRRHDWEINKSWLLYSPGVVSTLHTAVQALTKPGDSILIQTPVYPPFYNIVKNHDRNLVTNSLKLVNNSYEIDFEDFEEKLRLGVKAFILCNPHNPAGRVWTKEELTKMGELCLKYDVKIFSDEIHADLVYSNQKHIPIGLLSKEINEQTITCMSPTKTFNLAGLQVSYAVIPNTKDRDLIKDFFNSQGIYMLNTMGISALEAAYKYGESWLEELLSILEENRDLVTRSFKDRDEINIIEPEGTYLVWMDCRGLGLKNEELKKFMANKAKVGLNDGVSFGEESDGFMRMNIACPKAVLKDGIDRIITALDNYNKSN